MYSVEFSTGKRNYVFGLERFSEIVEEFKSLGEANHKEADELSDLRLDPDYLEYFKIEQAGAYKLFTIRFEGGLVGYCAFFIQEDMRHKGVVQAMQDMFFVLEAHRGIGFSFIRFCDELLERGGVSLIWRQSSSRVDIGKVYERLGYTFSQKTYVRRFN